MYEDILLATDGSEHADRAATHALAIAERFEATLHALYVIETRTGYDNALIEPDEVRENLRAIGEEALTALEDQCATRDVDVVTRIETGVPAECLLGYSEEHGIDLIVIGERGHSAFKTVMLGSTAEAVVYGSDLPVAVV